MAKRRPSVCDCQRGPRLMGRRFGSRRARAALRRGIIIESLSAFASPSAGLASVSSSATPSARVLADTHLLPPDPGRTQRCCATRATRPAPRSNPYGLPSCGTEVPFAARRYRLKARKLASEVPFDKIPSYRWRDLAVGERGLAGSLSFYARGQLRRDKRSGIYWRGGGSAASVCITESTCPRDWSQRRVGKPVYGW